MSLVLSMERPETDIVGAFVISKNGDLNLRNATELRTEILKALRSYTSVTFDASRVTSVDAGIVQVLLAAGRSAEQTGREFSIVAEAESALPDTLSRLGIAPVHA